MSQKSYDNSPTLYLIPTPIGNMEDITLRAINILKEVDVVFSEDTRETGILLKHLNIKKKLISNHDYNEEKNKKVIEEYLSSSKNVALVSDRGTPVISDPGYGIVKYIIEKGYNVVALPGATALIPALTISGLNPNHFLFYGFLNNRQTKRKEELRKLKNIEVTLIFYESPHRLEKTLNDMQEILGDRRICIAREISKKFEEVYRDKISNLINDIKNVKGEIVVVVEGNIEHNFTEIMTVTDHVNLLINDGYAKMDAIREVSKERNVPKSEIYNEYHK